jgi:hypothetical protein
MADDPKSEQERRRYIRLDVSGDVKAFDSEGFYIGRVDRVGGGGVQIRVAPESSGQSYEIGSIMDIRIVEPGSEEQRFHVEVRDRHDDILGVRFLQ